MWRKIYLSCNKSRKWRIYLQNWKLLQKLEKNIYLCEHNDIFSKIIRRCISKRRYIFRVKRYILPRNLKIYLEGKTSLSKNHTLYLQKGDISPKKLKNGDISGRYIWFRHVYSEIVHIFRILIKHGSHNYLHTCGTHKAHHAKNSIFVPVVCSSSCAWCAHILGGAHHLKVRR